MKICIVEDNARLRENLKILLEGEPGFSVTGSFNSAEDALRKKPWNGAEVMLADIDLPGISGVDLIRRVVSEFPKLLIMAYTIFEDRDTVFAAIKAGATGYLLKGAPPRELIESLRELYQGGAPMSPKIARKVLRELQQPGGVPKDDILSSREKSIVTGIAMGRSYKEISASLGISAHTVHTHIKNIYEKLQASSRSEALSRAREIGVI